MTELIYSVNIINESQELIQEIHKQKYSLGFMDFFFTEKDRNIDFVGKQWDYKVNISQGLHNAKIKLNTFKKRYEDNKAKNLYLDEKSEKEIKDIFNFIENKIKEITQIQENLPTEKLYLYSDWSEVLFMYDLEKDINFGENRKKQEKYINDLLDGAFSVPLESKEVTFAREKIKELRSALLRQARIIYIPEYTDTPIIWHFNEHILIKTSFVVQVYEKPLYDNPQHQEVIEFALKAIQQSLDARNTIAFYDKEKSKETLLEGKIILDINMLVPKDIL